MLKTENGEGRMEKRSYQTSVGSWQGRGEESGRLKVES